jgi:hypothetical protein
VAEGIQSSVKTGIGNLTVGTIGQLAATARRRLRRIQHRPGPSS